MFGATALGAVAAPLSTWPRPGEPGYLTGDAELDTLFAVEGFGGQDFAAALAVLRPLQPRLQTLIMLGRDCEDFVISAKPLAEDQAKPRDDALILYTSGARARAAKRQPMQKPAISSIWRIFWIICACDWRFFGDITIID